jgi:Kef-type K+ transport system membrane component KefB
MFARVGVLLLLCEVGLESTVGQMLQVGWSVFLVAVLGVAAPFALG